jgi:hypothetical protein
MSNKKGCGCGPSSASEDSLDAMPQKCQEPEDKGMQSVIRMTVIHRCFTVVAAIVVGIFLSGFDFSKHSIPLNEIQSGGPPKDGIPALLKPKFLEAMKAGYLMDKDRVLAVAEGGEAKAYPIRILNWHEVINDEINGKPILISYCPLCGTGMAFDPMINGRKYTFGVSGLLYNSDVLMYDHQTESLWSQIKQEAVTGEMTGTRLRPIFLIHTTWGEWRTEHPKTKVLSTDTGYSRNYSQDPYAGYEQSSRVIFPVNNRNSQYHPKEWVLGIVVNGEAKAYPFSELAKQPLPFADTVNGRTIQVHYDDPSKTAFITDAKGKPVPSVTGFWFAWYAFYPETKLFQGH